MNADEVSDKTLSEEKREHIKEINRYTSFLTPPLQLLEQRMAVFVAFFVVPVFALANAGLDLRLVLSSLFVTNIVVGFAIGLLLGNNLGIVGFTYLIV